MPRPPGYFTQWVENVVIDEAGRRPAPLGPAWVRERLRSASARGTIEIAASELERLDSQRASRTGTDYRADTGSTEVFRRATATLLPTLETIDTTAVRAASCTRTFANTSALATRKAHWRTQIDALATSSRAVLLDWIVGKQTFSANSTVQAATTEASEQLECLRRSATAAARGGSMAGPGTLAPTRTFDDQLCIWLWKFFFKASRAGLSPACSSTGATHAFGSMTDAAVAACTAAMAGSASHFTAGTEWQPVGTSARAIAHRTGFVTHLTEEQRAREILQTSSAPGISRHHWGTDVDLGSTTALDWTRTPHARLYTWLKTNALGFGVVQVYTPDRPGYTASSPRTGYAGYLEERWHWSYYPVAQALLEWARDNKPAVLARLQAAWTDVRTGSRYSGARTTLGFGTSTDPFRFIESRWEDFVFNVNRSVTPPVT
jgi:hypothetical protein